MEMCVDYMGIIAVNLCASNDRGKATGSTGSSKHINRLGRRQAHPVGGKQELEQGIAADAQGSSGGKLEGVFHVFTIYFVLAQPSLLMHHP